MFRKCLEDKYNDITKKLNIKESMNGDMINTIIKKELKEFMCVHSNVAIFGNGEHTHMLMVDYIYELKNIKYIIDNNYKLQRKDNGYDIINQEQLDDLKIDGVIISSTKFRKEMVRTIKEEYPQIAYLDIYEKFEDAGIYLNTPYYRYWYPANHYLQISRLKGKIAECTENDKKESLYVELLKKYIVLKDFQSATSCIDNLQTIDNIDKYGSIKRCIKELYQLELRAAEDIHQDNVLMLCIDGLRRKDYMSGLLPDLKHFCDKNMLFFANAYSCSTSTYESLIPAYSENDDLSTKYFESNEISEADCRFIREARKQERNIYFYTDAANYIKSGNIKRNSNYLTVTEKIWYFLLDAVEEKNGLFYLHIGYESHFPYVNPFTDNLITDGTNIMFDYLQRLGGKIRTDYVKQQQDSLRYLDYILTPFIKKMKLGIVIYADHGNILLDKDERIDNVCINKFSFHEDLIQIPLAIKALNSDCGQNERLISLMSINDIVISLLKKQKFEIENNDYVKIERSSIYNLEFQYLYRSVGKEQELKAFEVFIFDCGYKLAIYEDGKTKLFLTINDNEMDDIEIKQMLLEKVRDKITVCKGDQL